jgi:hypothetical protein
MLLVEHLEDDRSAIQATPAAVDHHTVTRVELFEEVVTSERGQHEGLLERGDMGSGGHHEGLAGTGFGRRGARRWREAEPARLGGGLD